MIILCQDGKRFVNFDNVNTLTLNDTYSLNQINIVAEFNNGKCAVIGSFDDIEYGKEVFQDLMMDYRGNAVLEVPKNRGVKLWKKTGTH